MTTSNPVSWVLTSILYTFLAHSLIIKFDCCPDLFWFRRWLDDLRVVLFFVGNFSVISDLDYSRFHVLVAVFLILPTWQSATSFTLSTQTLSPINGNIIDVAAITQASFIYLSNLDALKSLMSCYHRDGPDLSCSVPKGQVSWVGWDGIWNLLRNCLLVLFLRFFLSVWRLSKVKKRYNSWLDGLRVLVHFLWGSVRLLGK